MTRLLSILFIAMGLAGCAGQSTTTAGNEVQPEKSCDQAYRETASQKCENKSCPTHK